MYKVENKVLERISKHLKRVKKELDGNFSYDGSRRAKVDKENQKIIDLIAENYPG